SRPGPNTSRPTSGSRRRRSDGRRGGLPMTTTKARVLIRPKEGILDPQGKAVERALPALGFEGVEHVRAGSVGVLERDDTERVGEICEKPSANPLIEDCEIETL